EGRARDGSARQGPRGRADQGRGRRSQSRDDRLAVIASARFIACLIGCGAVAHPERSAPRAEAAPAQVKLPYASTPLVAAAAQESGRDGGEPRGAVAGKIEICWGANAASRPERVRANVSGIDDHVLRVLNSSKISDDLWASFFAVYVVTGSKTDRTTE